MNDWTLSIPQICAKLQTDSKKGLSFEEANRRLQRFGANELPRKSRIVWWKIFLNQFTSWIVWLLIVAAVVAAFLGEVIDAWAIIAIVVLNAGLGFFQEYRAERSLEALQQLASPITKVIRDGILQTILSTEVVPGDLVLLEAGDRIPADGRMIHTVQLTAEEAVLTGESVPVTKMHEVLFGEDLPLGDRKNMGFMGTIAVSGKGLMIVTKTALATEIGKIAFQLVGKEKEETPLQKQLDQLGKKLVFICLGVVSVVFGLGVLRGSGVIDMLLTSLSLAVAAIPEGLPAAVTIALSIGVRKMAEKKALIRRLSSVETLGSTAVICTDKTGTLTQNAMTVRSIWVDGEFIELTGSGYAPFGTFKRGEELLDPQTHLSLMWALEIGVLCNSASVQEKEGKWVIAGDPTEGALLTAAGKANLTKDALEERFILIEEIPFDSERKMMSVLRKENQSTTLFVKGAPDVVLNRCNRILLKGKEIALEEKEREEILHANAQLASQAFRVLAVAYRNSPFEPLEEDLTFVGLIAMMDPPRPEVLEALEKCKQAGIRTVMVTGDHKETALAVAKELEMLSPHAKAIDGKELDKMGDDQLERDIGDIAVFSRINAEHKLRIVSTYKKKQQVTAMTGDGINDAPAVQAADIGIAMGITGTDVTKESSDMVILDDNFASIVNAVEEGRGIYDNIVKFVSYLLSSNIAEILVIFITMLLGLTGPGGQPFVALLPVQLLWMNLVTDGFPAISLAMDPIDKRVMQRKPRKPKEGILTVRFSLFVCAISGLVTIGALASCLFGLQTSIPMSQTMTFTTLIVLELVRVQMIRKQYRLKLYSNVYLIWALISSFALQIIVLYIPSLQIVFGTVPLGWLQWAVILGIACVVWWLGILITRLFYREE